MIFKREIIGILFFATTGKKRTAAGKTPTEFSQIAQFHGDKKRHFGKFGLASILRYIEWQRNMRIYLKSAHSANAYLMSENPGAWAMTESKKKSSNASFRFEEIEHTADVALRVRGENLKELMKNAAEGMASLLCDRNIRAGSFEQKSIEVEAEDAEGLLVEWLSELAYFAETESQVYDSCEIERISPNDLKASVRSKKMPGLKVHIKAVTYHNLEIVETEKGLEAVVVFDI